MRAKGFQTQQDLVKEFLKDEPNVVTEKLRIPGVESLHLQPLDEVAEKLAEVFYNVLRSRSNLLEFRYSIGEFIEVTWRKN